MNQTNNTTDYKNYPSLFTWTSHLRAILCTFGILTNILNMTVFLNTKLKDPSYKYMLAKSISNVVYLTIAFSVLFFVYCSDCSSSRSYMAAFYSIGSYLFLASSLQLFRVSIEVFLSLQIYLTLANRNRSLSNNNNKLSRKSILAMLFILSLLVYSQQYFAYVIVESHDPDDGLVVYRVKLSEFGRSTVGKTLAITATSLRLFLAIIVLTILNILNVIEFRKRFANRKVGGMFRMKITPNAQKTKSTSRRTALDLNTSDPNDAQIRLHVINSNAIRNITRLVIFTSFLNIICATPYTIVYILEHTVYSFGQLLLFSSISYTLLICTPTLDIFVYYFFNRLYRDVLKSYFKKFFCLFKK